MYLNVNMEARGRCRLASVAWEKDRIGWGCWILLEHAQVWAGRLKWKEGRDLPLLFLWDPWHVFVKSCGVALVALAPPVDSREPEAGELSS